MTSKGTSLNANFGSIISAPIDEPVYARKKIKLRNLLITASKNEQHFTEKMIIACN
tara:strand:- start:4 stop:171 length:168 start_codon:yes stop_codon:yes gene_type:complete